MARNTESYDDVIDYMERIRRTNLKEWKKLDSLIRKLAEHGESIINGRTYKKLKTSKKTKLPIIQIKIITKQYRIHTVLTENYLYLLHAFDKKSDETPKNNLARSIKRANEITNF